jgi:2',3'-cyclic-nucleotide 2'-phosphodiesterase (5'-nucleotidase family)
VLLCSAGDILEFKPARTGKSSESRRQAEEVCHVLGRMDYDAIALGEKDLAFGPAFLRNQMETNGLPFICANAFDTRTGETVFPPYVVAEKEGVRVALLGVVSPERHVVAQVESALLEHKIEIRDPTEAALAHVPELREQADVVLLLAHTGVETARFLADDLPVDVVVVGHHPAISPEPEPHGTSVVVMAGGKSDRFGTLELTVAESGHVLAGAGAAIRLERKGPEDPELAAFVLASEQRVKEEKRQLALQRQREQEMRRAADKADQVRQRGGIMGAEACKACHEGIFTNWLETAHAHAFATLAEADAWDKPECLACHVTGQGTKEAVADVNLPPEVWNVQCEECHGSGLAHSRDGSYLGRGEETCRVCHTPEQSPGFHYESYLRTGVH